MAGYPCCCIGNCPHCTDTTIPDMQTTISTVSEGVCLTDCEGHNGEIPLAPRNRNTLPETVITPAQEGTKICFWTGQTTAGCTLEACVTCEMGGCEWGCSSDGCDDGLGGPDNNLCLGANCPAEVLDVDSCAECPCSTITLNPAYATTEDCECALIDEDWYCVCNVCGSIISACGTSQITHEMYLYVNEDGFLTIYYLITYLDPQYGTAKYHGEYVFGSDTVDCGAIAVTIDMEIIPDSYDPLATDPYCILDSTFTIDIEGVPV